MADMVGRSYTFGGGYDAAVVEITYGGTTYNAIVLLDFSASYAQPVTRLMSLGAARTMFTVAGHPEGSVQFNHATAPGPQLKAFINQFGDACRVGENYLQIKSVAGCAVSGGGSSTAANLTLKLKYVIMQQIATQASAGNPVSTVSGAMQFTQLDID